MSYKKILLVIVSCLCVLAVSIIGVNVTRGTLGSETPQTGTGFFISLNGHILTTYENVANASNIRVEYQGISEKAQLIGYDESNDLAVIKIEKTTLPVQFSYNSARKGENVLAIGYSDTGNGSLDSEASFGHINKIQGSSGDIRHYVIDAYNHTGYAGSPIFDKNGAVIGIASAVTGQVLKIGYARPLLETYSLSFRENQYTKGTDSKYLVAQAEERVVRLTSFR